MLVSYVVPDVASFSLLLCGSVFLGCWIISFKIGNLKMGRILFYVIKDNVN